jgi:hypothetical protein
VDEEPRLGARLTERMALLFDLDPHGRLVPQSDDTRRALGDRAGRFVLVPSAEDLLVARRTPATGASGTRPRCILAGDLSALPVADFVAFIHQSRLSGVLTLAAGGFERSIAFKDGEVRGAQSNAPGERIGEVTVRLGYANEEQVAQAMAGERPVGKALVDLGFVSASDLWKCFHEQVTAVFHAMLLAKAGTFFLVDEDVSERPGAPLAVSTQSLLMDGIRRIDEMSLFRARIPDSGAFLRRREPKRPITLTPNEQALIALVDGRRTVLEIAAAAHVNEFDATKVLYHLAEAGYVEAVADAATHVDPAARPEAIARELNALLRTVAAAVPEGGRPDFLRAVRSHLADELSPFAPVFTRLAPAADGALDEAALVANVEALPDGVLTSLAPSGDPGVLLLHALRELLFFYLFVAGERLDRAADEALSANVKRELAKLEGLG